MAGARRPGPIPAGPIDGGTLQRHLTPKPGTAGLKVAQAPRTMPVVEDGRPREMVVFSKEEFLKYAAIGAGLVSPMKDTVTDLRTLINELGLKGAARIASYKGNDYVILTGYAGLRKILTGTRYKATNPKVVELMIGRTRMIEGAVKGTAITIVLVVAVDVLAAVWGDQKTKDDLGITVSVDVMKAIGATAIALAASAMVVAGAAAMALTAPAWVPVAVGIGVGIAVSFAIDKAFPTSSMVNAMELFYQKHKLQARSWLNAAERDFMDLYHDAKEEAHGLHQWLLE